MICDECPIREGCIERRGLCRDYILYMERVERIRNQIEGLNENKEKVTGRSGADKGGIQEAGSMNVRTGNAGDRDPERLSPEACADAGTSAKAEGKREKAEGTTAEKAEEERGILDTGKRGKADPDVQRRRHV